MSLMKRGASAIVRRLDTEARADLVDRDDRRIDWVRCLPFLTLHAGCLAVVFVGFSWPALAAAVALFAVRMLAVTGFYHRYFSHKTFKTTRTMQFVNDGVHRYRA